MGSCASWRDRSARWGSELRAGDAPAQAGALEDAKAAGLVGERIDGYLGVVDSGAPADVEAAGRADQRRAPGQVRRDREKQGAPVEAVAQIAGKKLIERAAPGEYVMGAMASGSGSEAARYSPTWSRRPRLRADLNRSTKTTTATAIQTTFNSMAWSSRSARRTPSNRTARMPSNTGAEGRHQETGCSQAGRVGDRVVDAGQRLDQEDQRPGQALGAEPEAQHQRGDHQAHRPAEPQAG